MPAGKKASIWREKTGLPARLTLGPKNAENF
jgi:hypothetical protein